MTESDRSFLTQHYCAVAMLASTAETTHIASDCFGVRNSISTHKADHLLSAHADISTEILQDTVSIADKYL